jgi:2-hydroxychromene-2-carboxylate isomerase
MSEEEVKLYFDYKSPYAYLAVEPALRLPERFEITLRWIPFQLRIKGKGERSVYSEWKVRYSYLDARRHANRRGGFTLRGPRKVYDSTAALVGGLFAEREGFFAEYTREVYRRFFEHRLEIDDPVAVAALIEELGRSGEAFRAFVASDGTKAFERSVEEAHRDQVFGVPFFVFRGEPFWGQDRLPLLEERLSAAGLAREQGHA